MAICLGANLTIYAVVDAILVRPLPFPESDRLVAVNNNYPGAGIDHCGVSIPNYFDWTIAIKAFGSVSIFSETSTIVGAEGSPHREPIARISPEFFSTLGVPLAIGRSFTAAELAYGADNVAILTDGFWRSQFSADPKVLGRTFKNDGTVITVVGVLPRNFHFMIGQPEFYRPASHSPADRQPEHRHSEGSQMIARLAPGATPSEAQAEIDAFNAKQLADDPIGKVAKSMGYHTTVSALHDDYVRTVKPMLLMLQCGVLLLLLIGGVNLANLLLLQASGRTKELAVRRALGAGRSHLAIEALTETMVLVFAGSALGLLLGVWGIDILPALGTDKLPLGVSVAFDFRVVAVAISIAVVGSCLLAIPVLWFRLGKGIGSGLQTESRSGTVGREVQRLRHGFIVTQVALAFVLLSGSALLGISLRRVLEAPIGFNADQVITGSFSLPWTRYGNMGSRLGFIERLLPAVRSLPGVSKAAVISALPFTNTGAASGVAIEGMAEMPSQTIRVHNILSTAGEYWPLMGIRLLRGRLLEDADNQRGGVCVVDQAFAERYWPGADPLGHRLTPWNVKFNKDSAFTIVGVVANVKQNDLGENIGQGAIYLPFLGYPSFFLAVRGSRPFAMTAPMIRKAFLQLDQDLPIDDLRPMQSRIADSLVVRRSPAILAGIFAGVALLLASIGCYGVLSYSVSQREREIGVRMALGAEPASIRSMFLSIGIRLLAAGIVLGLIGAWGAIRAMQSMLFGTAGFLVPVLIGTVVVMSVIALAACLIPACRATQVDPKVALRAE